MPVSKLKACSYLLTTNSLFCSTCFNTKFTLPVKMILRKVQRWVLRLFSRWRVLNRLIKQDKVIEVLKHLENYKCMASNKCLFTITNPSTLKRIWETSFSTFTKTLESVLSSIMYKIMTDEETSQRVVKKGSHGSYLSLRNS